ncbi:MAG: L-lactate permease [Candidatus Thorarchaeota archaeon]
MEPILGLILIILPIVLAFVLLIFLHKTADVTGVIVWIVTVIIAIVAFQTDPGVAIIASIAGIVRSFPISLMVATSILMMTYMQETGSLQRLIVYFKTLGGGSKPMQIMFISLGLGLFLVGIGATPVTMLPPVMLALGFSPLVAVALPAIGYDPLTTFALLGIPAVMFTDVYNGAAGTSLQLWETGSVFALYMPIVTTGIAISMLWIAGGKKLLMSKEGILLAVISGVTAGGVAIIANTQFVNQTTLTNVFAGTAVMAVLYLYTRIKKRPMINRDILTEEDFKIEETMSLKKAMVPWTILVVLCLVTNVIPFVKDIVFSQLLFPIEISPRHILPTRFLWQAYFLMLVATVASFPFFKTDKEVLKNTFTKFKKRAPRPVLAAAIFFAMAEVMTYSGWVLDINGGWLDPRDPINGLDSTNNMIFLLASVTSATIGMAYPLTAAFIGLMAGFVSGSETSAIAMFTDYHYQASTMIGANSVVVAASSGIGGGLASILSPAKIQNAAAVIDEIGIEGDVIRYGAVVALLMTAIVAVMTFIWAFI